MVIARCERRARRKLSADDAHDRRPEGLARVVAAQASASRNAPVHRQTPVLDGAVAVPGKLPRLRADSIAARRLRHDLHRDARGLERDHRPEHRDRPARALRPRPADDRAVLEMDQRHRAARRFRAVVRVAAAGQRPDLGAHGAHSGAHARDIARHLGARVADRRVLGRAQILDRRLFLHRHQLLRARHPVVPAGAGADVRGGGGVRPGGRRAVLRAVSRRRPGASPRRSTCCSTSGSR